MRFAASTAATEERERERGDRHHGSPCTGRESVFEQQQQPPPQYIRSAVKQAQSAAGCVTLVIVRRTHRHTTFAWSIFRRFYAQRGNRNAEESFQCLESALAGDTVCLFSLYKNASLPPSTMKSSGAIIRPTVAALLLLLLLLVCAEAREYDHCYSYESDPYLLMGTKTAYHFIRGTNRLPSIPNCAPVQMWMLSRHGTRYPSRKAMLQLQTLGRLRDQIIYNHETRGNGRMCNPDLEKLRNWSPPAGIQNESTADFLTIPQGKEDMQLLAKRLQSYFPELLRLDPINVNSQTYKFKATKAERTVSSMESFKEGLFNSRFAIPTEDSAVTYNETLLRLYKHCPAWENSLDRDRVDHESESFINKTEYHNLLMGVSMRLGFNYQIKNDSVQLMYDMCRYEKAWYVDRLSAWCSVFSKDELKVLEYLEDLDYYYYSGPGREINARLGCPLIQDMFNHFKDLERGSYGDEPKGIFYFGHTITVQTFLAAMGIGQDRDPIRGDDYHRQHDRKFRTSRLSSFASNLVAIFYRCSDARSPNQVMFYLNEEPLQIDGCQVGLCPWEYLKQRFGRAADECSTEFCFNSSAMLRSSLGLAVLLATLLLL